MLGNNIFPVKVQVHIYCACAEQVERRQVCPYDKGMMLIRLITSMSKHVIIQCFMDLELNNVVCKVKTGFPKYL